MKLLTVILVLISQIVSVQARQQYVGSCTLYAGNSAVLQKVQCVDNVSAEECSENINSGTYELFSYIPRAMVKGVIYSDVLSCWDVQNIMSTHGFPGLLSYK